MPRESAGILVYRRKKEGIEVFLVHPGGPFWKNKDEGAWSIPKGELEEAETSEKDRLERAKKEVEEETGISLSGNDGFIDLGKVKQKAGKVVHCWGLEKDWDDLLRQNFISIEWPPKSGKKIKVPEVDKARYFSIDEAGKKINPAQREFLERLAEKLNQNT